MKSPMKKNQTGKRERSDKKSHLNGVNKEGPSEEVTVEQTPKCTWQSRACCMTPGKCFQEAGAANTRALGEQCSWCVWGTARRPLWLDRITRKVKIKDLTLQGLGHGKPWASQWKHYKKLLAEKVKLCGLNYEKKKKLLKTCFLALLYFSEFSQFSKMNMYYFDKILY